SQRLLEADKRTSDQRTVAARSQDKTTPIRVRIATLPTFTRYVFELPEAVAVAANSSKDKLTLTFDSKLKFDLADARAALPPMVETIDSEIAQDRAVVRFAFTGKVDLRTFREDSNFVVDLTPLDTRPEAAARSDALAAIAAEMNAKMNAPPPGLEAPQTMPAPPAASPPPRPAAPPLAQAQPAADTPPQPPEDRTRPVLPAPPAPASPPLPAPAVTPSPAP